MEIINNQKIINLLTPQYNAENKDCVHADYSNVPSFKGNMDTILRKTGDAMNWIEKGGFLVLFLIQDFLGMTVPRTIAGFLRDKEQTGEYNIQEGFEVLGREGLTGPCMMAVAPFMLWLGGKFWGNSIGLNSELIKQYADSLKEMVSAQDFDKNLLKSPASFKESFYKKNIRNILELTIGKDKFTEESVNYILEELKHYENIPKDAQSKKLFWKSKYRSRCLENITDHINNLKYNSDADLDLLRKIKMGSEKNKNIKTFSTNNAFEGLIKFSNDTISGNKCLEKLDGLVVESIKNKTLGKRVLINIGMITATLGLLSYLPKLYIRSNTAPGATKKNDMKISNSENVAFKGKKTNIIEEIGKKVDKNKNSFISSELEYNGYNFTNTLMAGLSIFGLLAPRCKKAYNRAQTDENGKKDYTELWEILIRDISSSLAVVFAVPMITRACVTSYEKNSGFVLMQKDRTPKSFMKRMLDIINPYSKTHVLSNAEISALYDNINTKEKLLNFCKYIDKNGGSLYKILSKAENIRELLNESTTKLDKLQTMTKSNANEEIIEIVKNIETNAKKLGLPSDKHSINKLIEKTLKGVGKGKNSRITAFARGLNSVPGMLTTLVISPYILGWVIPRFTYKNTRRIHEKEEKEKNLTSGQKMHVKA